MVLPGLIKVLNIVTEVEVELMPYISTKLQVEGAISRTKVGRVSSPQMGNHHNAYVDLMQTTASCSRNTMTIPKHHQQLTNLRLFYGYLQECAMCLAGQYYCVAMPNYDSVSTTPSV